MGDRCTGHCCKLFTLAYLPLVLLAKGEAMRMWRNGAKRVYSAEDCDIVADMVQWGHREPDGPGRAFYYYTCTKLLPNGDCSIYESRPAMCREYPYQGVCPYPECTWDCAKNAPTMAERVKEALKAAPEPQPVAETPERAEEQLVKLEDAPKDIETITVNEATDSMIRIGHIYEEARRAALRAVRREFAKLHVKAEVKGLGGELTLEGFDELVISMNDSGRLVLTLGVLSGQAVNAEHALRMAREMVSKAQALEELGTASLGKPIIIPDEPPQILTLKEFSEGMKDWERLPEEGDHKAGAVLAHRTTGEQVEVVRVGELVEERLAAIAQRPLEPGKVELEPVPDHLRLFTGTQAPLSWAGEGEPDVRQLSSDDLEVTGTFPVLADTGKLLGFSTEGYVRPRKAELLRSFDPPTLDFPLDEVAEKFEAQMAKFKEARRQALGHIDNWVQKLVAERPGEEPELVYTVPNAGGKSWPGVDLTMGFQGVQYPGEELIRYPGLPEPEEVSE